MSENTMKKTKKRRSKVGRVIKKWIKRLILLAVLIVAGLFGLKAYIKSTAGSDSDAETYSRTAVTRGAMEETVYGTGTTSARSQPNVLAQADGTLTDLRVSVGDTVSEGDILAILTNEDLDDQITDYEFTLWDLDDTIQSTSAGSKVTTVEAPAAGVVKAIYANVGDDALAVFRREGALAIISTDGRMKVELDNESGAFDLAYNERVTVKGDGFEEEGTVVDLTLQGTHATITVLNDSLPMDAEVTVMKEDGTVIGQGTLEVNKPLAVSSYGGTIQTVRVSVGDTVKRRDTLFRLEDSPLSLTVENLRLQRETAAQNLEEAKQQRENLIVTAPCDGVIASLNVSEGDEITSGTLLCSILEGEDMNLTISVDELDVVEVEVGQKVTITIDALSDVELEGEVYKIAPVGTNSGGVTTYDVELTFDAAGTGVRSGMNATGEITVASTDDTLYVPVEALMTVNNQTYVMVADSTGVMAMSGMGDAAGMSDLSDGGMPDGDDAQMNDAEENGSSEGRQRGAGRGQGGETAQSGNLLTQAIARIKAWLYEGVDTGSAQQVSGSLVRVEVGMQNDDYAEILSGVSEGDVVLYTGSTTTTDSVWSVMGGSMGGGNNNNRGGDRGGMGGGSPMGF
ncbi:MAG: HlyD family efflux transporter periplasmic adaptor subunit [Clostridia bacterium]|nr:HlyD family efflux transporter periplasmic adaptor subunit [Clostridia bacterium]